jgi:hypothetical protein
MNLFEHSQGCLPLVPCAACETVAWLRSKLSPDEFAELVKRAQALNPPKPKRSYRRRRLDEQNADPQQAAAGMKRMIVPA